MSNPSPAILTLSNGHTLAYHTLNAKNTQKPSIVFLGGFQSDMEGTKALFLQQYCAERGLGYTRFDYRGHGASSDTFANGTIGDWAEDALAIFDNITAGKQLLIGSSMGGWIMLLTALKRPERIHSLIGIAAAPDFTEDLIYSALSDAQKTVLERDGVVHIPHDYAEPGEDDTYPITQRLLTEARNHLLLRDTIPLTCPVRLLHGLQDTEVPTKTLLTLTDKLASDDVTLQLIKSGDHRMSSPACLTTLTHTIEELLALDG